MLSDWIDRYGDLDGDGFVDYQRRSSRRSGEPGLEGLVGWHHASRRLVAQTPIALVEVQGYVYEAKYRMVRCSAISVTSLPPTA